MTLSFDLYFSIRSPYSYFAVELAKRMMDTYDVVAVHRPVYPIAIRTPEFFKKVDRRYRPYQMNDCIRVAAFHGIPYRRPVPDPIRQNLATYELEATHPLAERLTRLAVAAALKGRGGEFALHVMRILWDGKTDDWDKGLHLKFAVARAGLDLDELDAMLADERPRIEAELERNHQDHGNAGHWGVPVSVFEGEPFFGQDRLDVLVWRMKQKGLKERG